MGCGASSSTQYEKVQSTIDAVRSEAEQAVSQQGGEWRIEEAPGMWVSMDAIIGAELMEAWNLGQVKALYAWRDTSFEVDFKTCIQTNRATGRQQRIGFFPDESTKADAQKGKESIWEDPVEATSTFASTSPSVYLGGKWKVEESPDVWRNLGPEASAELIVGWYCGDEQLEYSVDGDCYEVDLKNWVQRNKRTGQEQRIGWIPGYLETKAEKDEAPSTEATVEAPQDEPSQEWLEQGAEEEQLLLAALSSGKKLVRYTSNGYDYEVDTVRMLQTNLTTGEQWMVGIEQSNTMASESKPAESMSETCQEREKGASAQSTEEESAKSAKAFAAEPPPSRPGNATSSSSTGLPEEEQTGASEPKVASEPKAVPTAWCQGKPRAYVYKAAPGPRRPSKQKKWSLEPGRQKPRLVAPKAKAKTTSASGGGASMPGRPEAGWKLPSSSQAKPKLPSGVEWPKDEKARKIVEAVFKDMDGSKKQPLDQRRRAYRAICLSWHPDKNQRHQELATQVFQFLQSLKSWYFA
eukprot:TRINITY_DN34368_c0_g1_i1.p1 TRINITY_DN34368_c0_g1~~TRINITY_DN34368_c0_g1_i1.p1  ORF type:complete len:522 (+),score=129.28 TRINITY_DN34368_c0_g1_i1:66-1631(+)